MRAFLILLLIVMALVISSFIYPKLITKLQSIWKKMDKPLSDKSSLSIWILYFLLILAFVIFGDLKSSGQDTYYHVVSSDSITTHLIVTAEMVSSDVDSMFLAHTGINITCDSILTQSNPYFVYETTEVYFYCQKKRLTKRKKKNL